MTRHPPPPIGLILAGVGFGLLVTAVILVLLKRARMKHWIRTTGEVAGYFVQNRRRTVLFPKVSYEANGQTMTLMGELGRSSRSRNVGDAIGVVYDPDAPQSARIDEPLEIHFSAFVVGVLGAIGAVNGLMMAFVLE